MTYMISSQFLAQNYKNFRIKWSNISFQIFLMETGNTLGHVKKNFLLFPNHLFNKTFCPWPLCFWEQILIERSNFLIFEIKVGLVFHYEMYEIHKKHNENYVYRFFVQYINNIIVEKWP